MLRVCLPASCAQAAFINCGNQLYQLCCLITLTVHNLSVASVTASRRLQKHVAVTHMILMPNNVITGSMSQLGCSTMQMLWVMSTLQQHLGANELNTGLSHMLWQLGTQLSCLPTLTAHFLSLVLLNHLPNVETRVSLSPGVSESRCPL